MNVPPDRRSTSRQAAPGIAWLTAVDCHAAAAGERAEASVVDLSTASVGVRIGMPLRAGDRLEFHGRFFDLALDAEVEVASARPPAGDGETTAGCVFSSLSADQRLALERILLGRAAQDDLGLVEAFRRSA
ncbi:MAG TPA: PilZ domain-containing protein [Gaiellales bacterium]|nr:PilZ domain-containing protein [Gaiellales bacterium]